ncbi:MAG TPA: ThuA domain-containing protein [Planctomycetota bacterium]
MLLLLAALAAQDVKVLVVDGQNNHNWAAMTPFMKARFEETGKFKVDVSTTPSAPPGKKKDETPEQAAEREKKAAALKPAWDAWRPKFSDYKVVVSNYNGQPWPEAVQKDFEAFVAAGGGVLVIHAANNAFPQWGEYNKMIGLGWRDNKFGDRVYYDDAGELKREAKGEGKGAGHGEQHEFLVTMREEHPITKGLPKTWMHAKDELYHGQRGPAADMKILASAFDDKKTKGTGVHEPMLWVIPYGKGQVVTNVMGHENGQSVQCVAFTAINNRAIEWLATGQVTLPLPANMPTADKSSVLPK